jgi:hypothetical protein
LQRIFAAECAAVLRRILVVEFSGSSPPISASILQRILVIELDIENQRFLFIVYTPPRSDRKDR